MVALFGICSLRIVELWYIEYYMRTTNTFALKIDFNYYYFIIELRSCIAVDVIGMVSIWHLFIFVTNEAPYANKYLNKIYVIRVIDLVNTQVIDKWTNDA